MRIWWWWQMRIRLSFSFSIINRINRTNKIGKIYRMNSNRFKITVMKSCRTKMILTHSHDLYFQVFMNKLRVNITIYINHNYLDLLKDNFFCKFFIWILAYFNYFSIPICCLFIIEHILSYCLNILWVLLSTSSIDGCNTTEWSILLVVSCWLLFLTKSSGAKG